MIPVKEISTSTPGYRLAAFERETIIRFDETPDSANVYTHNPALIRKLDALAEERPEDVICTIAESVNGIQCRSYNLPKKWIKINAPRVLSEEEIEKRREQLRINKSKSDAQNAVNYREITD